MWSFYLLKIQLNSSVLFSFFAFTIFFPSCSFKIYDYVEYYRLIQIAKIIEKDILRGVSLFTYQVATGPVDT